MDQRKASGLALVVGLVLGRWYENVKPVALRLNGVVEKLARCSDSVGQGPDFAILSGVSQGAGPYTIRRARFWMFSGSLMR